MNPENIIRPPVLNTNVPPPSNNPQVTPELANIIRTIVSQVIATDAPSIIQNLVHPNKEIVTDQTIDVRYAGNLSGLDRVPDVVKCLRDFSGDPKEFASWKKSVERILKIYEHEKGTPRYFGILNVVRNKIIGNADVALESYNTPLNWEAISKCLNTHYADKRDISTLEYQLSSLYQGNKSVNDFYQDVFSHLSLILNKVSCLEIGHESLNLLTKTYRDKALDTFVRGLNGELPKLIGIREPTDLPQALQLCMKLQNQNYRTQHAFGNQQTYQKSNIPQYPPRKQQYQTFYPNLAHIPQPMPRYIGNPAAYGNMQPQYSQNHQYQQKVAYPLKQATMPYHYHNPPPRPSQPKPPVPMEIDESQRTRNINYMNRPNNNDFTGKRPNILSNQEHRPFKQNRINHIETVENTDNNTEQQDKEQNIQPWEEYYEQYSTYDKTPTEDTNEFSDIHFLG